MSSVVEQTLKALVDFESQLEAARLQASDSKKRLIKDSAEWAEAAKTSAIAKAQEMAAQTVSKARSEAEKEAGSIRKKGEASLRSFESAISKKKAKATEAVVARLIGGEE